MTANALFGRAVSAGAPTLGDSSLRRPENVPLDTGGGRHRVAVRRVDVVAKPNGQWHDGRQTMPFFFFRSSSRMECGFRFHSGGGHPAGRHSGVGAVVSIGGAVQQNVQRFAEDVVPNRLDGSAIGWRVGADMLVRRHVDAGGRMVGRRVNRRRAEP